ncbi:MAG TPA: DNA methyltransferase [Verrucomicrobiae bacterium]|nr:DNA methyltransferase [Verrucomicrobiae bacterium]
MSEGKTGALYNAHSYHTKVPPKAIENYIRHFTEPGEIILDGFSGTGMTGAAVHCTNEDRRCILVDLSPAAAFISALYNSSVDPSEFNRYADAILQTVEHETQVLYETRQPKTNKLAIIDSVIWSTVLMCPSCNRPVPFWFLKERGDQFECPECKAISTRTAYEYSVESFVDPVNKQLRKRNKKVPVQITYKVGSTRRVKAPDEADIRSLTDVARILEAQWFPTEPFLGIGAEWGDTYRAGYHRGYEYTYDFYFVRALAVLSRLRSAAMEAPRHLRIHLLGLLTSVAFAATHLYKYRTTGGGQPAGNNLYIPALIKEQNVIAALRRKLNDLVAAEQVKRGWRRSTCVSNASATELHGVPDASVDYVFVDPPFGANIMYSESSFLWEAWLKVRTDQTPEAIVNDTQHKGLPEYQALMTSCFREFLRVLKPGRWMTVEFHNSQNAVWASIQEALGSAGFVVADVRTLDKKQGTFKQVTTSGAVKQDLIISAYRPNGGLEARFRLEAGTEDGVWDFIRTHLKQLPVCVLKAGRVEVIAERLNYLLFDRMVAFHVQRGVSVPISASDFYAGLQQRFSEREGMYFLTDQVAEYDKKRVSVKEVLQLEIFVSDEASAIQWLKQQLTKKPQTFQEIHPDFIREIGGWQKHEKPLELLDLLRDNFLPYDGTGDVPSQVHSYLSSNWPDLRKKAKDDPALRAKAKDRWYVPDPKKVGDLEKLRERSLLKEFEEYRVSAQKRLKVFRLEAVRAGFKRAWQDRDYDTIIGVARKVPEEVLQEDPKLLMWYDQAMTRKGENT